MRFDVSVILKAAVPILLGLVLGAALAAAAGAAEPSKMGVASHNQTTTAVKSAPSGTGVLNRRVDARHVS